MKAQKSPVVTARSPLAMLLVSALALLPAPSFAQVARERLADKDVKALIDEVDEGRDKFEGNLDGQFKSATIKNANGETKVSVALQDYQDNTKKLKERFAPDYAAGAEVTTVLKQSTAIDGFMQRQPSAMKGRSEWDRQVANLKQLADAYGTTFPLAAEGVARRLNDAEAASVAGTIATAANRFKSDLDKDKTIPKPEKEMAKKNTEELIKQANTVKSRLSDGKPASSEVRRLAEQVATIQAFVTARPLPASTSWPAVQASLNKLQQAFGQPQ
jgi:hypothetical protein